MNDAATLTGGCLCGAVRFEVKTPTKWCAHCHCSLCRRAHGAAFVTWFGVERPNFELVSGTDALAWYQSSGEARRGFCGRCGSPLFFESERWAEEVHIALAHMDGPIDREPKAHVFYDAHVDWVVLGDELSRFGGATGNEPLD